MSESPNASITGHWSESGARVLRERYLLKKDGKVVETPDDMCRRVARAVAVAERNYTDDKHIVENAAEHFASLMLEQKFMPNSPTLMNAGKGNGLQLSACFVLPVDDSISGIFETMKHAAIIHQSGGGCIAADARVWTTFCGIEPIEVLFNRATIDGRFGTPSGSGTAFDVRDLGIKTLSMDPETGETGLRDVTHIWKFDVPADHQVQVTTREGAVVQTSDWHPFMVVRGTELQEVQANELRAGDVVLGPETREDMWPWKDYRQVGSLVIDPALGWLVGFTLSDGSFGYVPALRQYRVRWFSGTSDVLERVLDVLQQHGIATKIQKDQRGLLSVATLAQRFVHDLLEACGLEKFGSKDARIRVPEIIAKSPLPVIRAFLAGLLDGDGYVAPDGSPSYTTVSESMAEDLAALLGLLGYRPTTRSKAPYGKGRQRTYTVQLCPLPQVNDLAADLAPDMANVERVARFHSDSIKESALSLSFRDWHRRFVALGIANSRGQADYAESPFALELSQWASHGRVSRPMLRRIASFVEPLDVECARLLQRLAARGQEIERVERAPVAKPYYDMTVTDWNTYAAGKSGMLMIHNTGFAFSRLRPKGATVKSTHGVASGPVSFLRVYDAATESVKQGGTRRGANMGILRCDHPDIMEFIECKLDGGITNFNISVAITDAFMDALDQGNDYDLINPQTKEASGKLNAHAVWQRMAECAWKTGDPGVVFIDRMNNSTSNPAPDLLQIEATNPCGEQALYPYDVCNLGSINLANVLKRQESCPWEIDWEELERCTKICVRFLDDVIDINPYPLQQITDIAQRFRRIGLGVMGWADMLFRLGIPYNSQKALDLGEQVMRFVTEAGRRASEDLAKVRGPFPEWAKSRYRDGAPLRNGTVTTVAPTGTISIIADCSSGIEPIFALAFSHIVGERHLTFINPIFEEVAKEQGFYSDALMAKVAEHGSVQGVDGVTAELQRVFVIAHEIEPDWHIRMQAAFQAGTDNCISKTINLPNHATVEDIAAAYKQAYELGCRGITVYRDGSKFGVLHVGTAKKEEGKPEVPATEPLAEPPVAAASDVEEPQAQPAAAAAARAHTTSPYVLTRPRRVSGYTYRTATPVGTAFVVINSIPESGPFEVFVTVGNAGSDLMADAEALGRLVSLYLRSASWMSPEERLLQVASQLRGIGGSRSLGFGKDRVRSLPDAVAMVLEEHVHAEAGEVEVDEQPKLPVGNGNGKHTKHPIPVLAARVSGDLCPTCGSAGAFVYEEGCKKCHACGHSEC